MNIMAEPHLCVVLVQDSDILKTLLIFIWGSAVA